MIGALARSLPAFAVLLAVTSVGANGPAEKRVKELLPVAPATAPVPDALHAGTEFRAPTRPLQQLIREATLVALVDVVRTAPYDDGRIQVFQVRLARTLHGKTTTPEIDIVDIRGDSRRPPLLVDGEHVVVVLRDAARLSYLTQQLGEGTRYELLARRDGVVPIGRDDDVDLMTELVAASVAQAPSDGTVDEQAVATRRALARRSLLSGSARLVQDGVVAFADLPGWPPLSDEEIAAFRTALRDRTVPALLRVQGLRLLAERKAVQALGAVTSAEVETAELLDAVLAARLAMGAPASTDELTRYLKSDDPATRGAAVRALAAQGDVAAVTAVGRVATDDRDVDVRTAAIDALGTTGSPTAVPIVARTFDGDDRSIRQHAGRALLALGGEAADQSFIDLALKAKSVDSRKYAALLLIVLRGHDHPVVQRLLASHPDNDVKAVIEHGLEFQHMHKHE